MGSGRLCVAAAEPGRRRYEVFCIYWRGERPDQSTGMPVLEWSPFDPFLLIEICFTVAELQHIDSSFFILAIKLERASVFLPLYRGLTHSRLTFGARHGPDSMPGNRYPSISGAREQTGRCLSRVGSRQPAEMQFWFRCYRTP